MIKMLLRTNIEPELRVTNSATAETQFLHYCRSPPIQYCSRGRSEVVRLSAEGMSIKSGNEVKCRPAELPPIEVTFIFCFFQRIPASQLLKGLLGRWAGVCLWKNMSRGVIKYLSSCLRRALGTRLWLPSVLCEVILSPLLCGCHQMLAA